jgi:hypothetical protein
MSEQKSQALTVVRTGFDYSRVVPAVADQLREHAATIRKIGYQSIIDMGRELTLAKKKLRGDGKLWGEWCEPECGLKLATAENMMRVAAHPAANRKQFAILPPAALYEIFRKSTPSAALNDIESRLEAGNVLTVREVKAVIAAAKPTNSKVKARAPSSERTKFLTLMRKVCRVANYKGPIDVDVVNAAHDAANVLFNIKTKLYDIVSKQNPKPQLRWIEGKLRVIDGGKK